MMMSSVAEFCHQHGISRGTFYKLLSENRGPKAVKSKHPPRTAEGHSPRPPIWPTRHDPIPRACGEGPGWGFDARSLLLRSDLAQAVDDAALRRHRVFREA